MRSYSMVLPLLLFTALLAPATAQAQAPAPSASNYWFTLNASASSANDSFGDVAETGMLLLGGAHRRLGDRLTLGLEMGAHHWPGKSDLTFDGVQVSLDARFFITRPSSRFRPFVQLGGGSYQMASSHEPEGAELQRVGETSFGVNFGGGLLFAVGSSAKLGPVVRYHSAGQIPEIAGLTGSGDCKFVSVGLELVMPMGR